MPAHLYTSPPETWRLVLTFFLSFFGLVEIKQEPNKSGGGEGQWAAWKASKLAKEYEARGGGYENEAGSRNEPKQGEPEKKSEGKKREETEG